MRASETSLPIRSGREFRLDPRAWRLLPIETYPTVVTFVQTIPGKLALFTLFAAFMKLHAVEGWVGNRATWLLLPAAAALVSLAGRLRGYALLACAAALLAYDPTWISFAAPEIVLRREYLYGTVYPAGLRALTLIACVPLAILMISGARALRHTALGRRPVLVQHVFFACLLGLATSGLLKEYLQVAAWSVLAAFSAYFWYLAYALMDQRQRQPAPIAWQLASLNPFAWPTLVPMGKGAANWRTLEAQSAEELAVTQLKGLKLLVWALCLSGVLGAFRWTVYGQLGIVELTVAFDQFLQGKVLPTPFTLVSVAASLPERLLVMAIMGHIIIAVARLAGFRLLRNTYRPLSARTVAEFWNRYVYYFKEILVQVYFYPTFVRCFKRHPRLRVAFATFMAAGVGNFFFHFMMQTATIARHGFGEALLQMQTYGFYCLLLSGGIVISQLRTHRTAASAGWVRLQLLPSLWVAAFFCLLSFFDGPQRHVSLALHFEFLLRCFGIGYLF